MSMRLVSPQEYFREVVEDAVQQRKLKIFPLAQHYLVQLLQHYMNADNLFDEETPDGQRRRETLAEMYLRASTDPNGPRIDLLKKLGDVSLYVSGFFGDSLNRKVVDVDYYADMGGTAYGVLAQTVKEDMYRQVYGEYAKRFLDFVDILTYISQKTLKQNNDNLLRLFEVYARTGSNLAKEQLLEKGIITLSDTDIKKTKQ